MRSALLGGVLGAAILAMPLAAHAGPSAEVRLRALAASIAQDPGNPQLRLRRALVHSDIGHYQSALADIDAAARADPDGAVLARGVVHYRSGNSRQARREFDRFLEKHPGHAGALEYRARARRDAGDAAGALADYERLLAANPRAEPGHYVAAARLLAQAPGRGPDAALALLDERIRAVGAIPQLQRLAVAIERRRGNHRGAVARLGAVDSRTRNSPAWHAEMAELLALQGQPAAAAGHIARARHELARRKPTVANRRLEARLARLDRSENPPGSAAAAAQPRS